MNAVVIGAVIGEPNKEDLSPDYSTRIPIDRSLSLCLIRLLCPLAPPIQRIHLLIRLLLSLTL